MENGSVHDENDGKAYGKAGRMPDTASHMEYESGRLNAFLPQLYDLWKDHPDPWQNIHFDLTTVQNPDGTWAHKYPNRAPSL